MKGKIAAPQSFAAYRAANHLEVLCEHGGCRAHKFNARKYSRSKH
jgi:hypothetical protein